MTESLPTTAVVRVSRGSFDPGRFAEVDAVNKKVSEYLDELLDSDLQMYEIKVGPDGARVIARNKVLVVFTDADAEPQKLTKDKLAASTIEAIKSLIWRIQFNRVPTASETP